MTNFLRSCAVLLAFLAAPVFAQEAPDALVRRVSGEVLDLIKTDKDIQSGDTKRASQLIDEKVAPHFDFRRMTALAMATQWKNATPAQKDALAKEFHTLLVRSYSSALTQYKNQTLSFKPLRMKPEDTDVTVRSEIRQPGAKSVSIDYDLAKIGTEWKVYDVFVEGVSLVVNYRSTFADEIKNNGIDGLINSLKEKNAKSSSDAKK